MRLGEPQDQRLQVVEVSGGHPGLERLPLAGGEAEVRAGGVLGIPDGYASLLLPGERGGVDPAEICLVQQSAFPASVSGSFWAGRRGLCAHECGGVVRLSAGG